MLNRPSFIICERCHRASKVPRRGVIPRFCPDCRGGHHASQAPSERPCVRSRQLDARHETIANQAAAQRRSTRILDTTAILANYRHR